MEQIEVARFIRGPREQVFARYSDHRSWPRWTGLGPITVALRPQGQNTPDGVGCVRVVSAMGRELVAEEITTFESPSRMVYRIVRGGGPITDHEGDVRFESQGAGTRVVWRVRFRSTVPGAGVVLRLGLRLLFTRILRRLAADFATGG